MDEPILVTGGTGTGGRTTFASYPAERYGSAA